MSEENENPEPTTGHLNFTEADTPLIKTVIGTFIDSFNAYCNLVQHADLHSVLANLLLKARALQQIGEVDESYVLKMEEMVRSLSNDLNQLGRWCAFSLQSMNTRRGGQVSTESVENEWPDVVEGGEQ